MYTIACKYIYTYTHLYICIYIYVYICVCVCAYKPVHICVCVCLCVRVRVSRSLFVLLPQGLLDELGPPATRAPRIVLFLSLSLSLCPSFRYAVLGFFVSSFVLLSFTCVCYPSFSPSAAPSLPLPLSLSLSLSLSISLSLADRLRCYPEQEETRNC